LQTPYGLTFSDEKKMLQSNNGLMVVIPPSHFSRKAFASMIGRRGYTWWKKHFINS